MLLAGALEWRMRPTGVWDSRGDTSLRPDLRGERGTGGLCEGQLGVSVQESHPLRLNVRGPSEGLMGITHYPRVSHLLHTVH